MKGIFCTMVDIVGPSMVIMDIMKRAVSITTIQTGNPKGTKAKFVGTFEPGNISLVADATTHWLIDLMNKVWIDNQTLNIKTKEGKAVIKECILCFQEGDLSAMQLAMESIKQNFKGVEIIPLTGTPVPYDQKNSMYANYKAQADAPLVMDRKD